MQPLTHIPVLLDEILAGFEPLQSKSVLRYFDGTLGRGGHLRAVLQKFPQVQAFGIDRDPQALEEVGIALAPEIQAGRLQLEQANFHDFDPHRWGQFDLMLLDLGVSSPQLDQASRGFSFYHEGPLDMRMDPQTEKSAADWLNELEDEELFRVFRDYGEIHRPWRVVNEIVKRRQEKPFRSTLDLSMLIERVEGWRRKGFHPATPYFMALRILVNNELRGLEESLPRLLTGLRPGGRLAVLTFHSLEDRIVKTILRESNLGRPVNKKVIQPTRDEELRNPRSRSAKLRIFERENECEDAMDGIDSKGSPGIQRT